MKFPIRGIFTSHWSSDPPAAPIDWKQLRQAGYTYAFIKATDWINYKPWIDPAFERDWYESQSSGFLASAMHYFRPGVSPSAQADHLLSVLGRHGRGQLPPSLDVEEHPPANVNLFPKVFDYLGIIADNVAGRPVFYTSPGFWDRYFRTVLEPDRWLMWVAHWTRIRSSPIIPKGFPAWHFWQHLEHTNRLLCPPAPGITGPACPDRFNGSYQDLLDLCLPSPEDPILYPVYFSAAERRSFIDVSDRLRGPFP